VLIHVCWMCNTKTGHEEVVAPRILGLEVQKLDSPYASKLACAAYACSVCKGISIGCAAIPYDYNYNVQTFFDEQRGDDLFWRPDAGETKNYPEVPDHIGKAATEAYECDSRQHYRAAILLARSVIEATAKDKEITSGNLHSKIDQLAKAGHIRPLIQNAAHSVRMFGNDMAHGDFVQPISGEESRQVIHIMGEILNEVFQQPAMVQQVTAAAQARRENGTT
jgi:hypothetical protein